MEHVRRSFWNRHEGIDGVDWKRAERIVRLLRDGDLCDNDGLAQRLRDVSCQQVAILTRRLRDHKVIEGKPNGYRNAYMWKLVAEPETKSKAA
jgi:hypothetical protein